MPFSYQAVARDMGSLECNRLELHPSEAKEVMKKKRGDLVSSGPTTSLRMRAKSVAFVKETNRLTT